MELAPGSDAEVPAGDLEPEQTKGARALIPVRSRPCREPMVSMQVLCPSDVRGTPVGTPVCAAPRSLPCPPRASQNPLPAVEDDASESEDSDGDGTAGDDDWSDWDSDDGGDTDDIDGALASLLRGWCASFRLAHHSVGPPLQRSFASWGPSCDSWTSSLERPSGHSQELPLPSCPRRLPVSGKVSPRRLHRDPSPRGWRASQSRVRRRLRGRPPRHRFWSCGTRLARGSLPRSRMCSPPSARTLVPRLPGWTASTAPWNRRVVEWSGSTSPPRACG